MRLLGAAALHGKVNPHTPTPRDQLYCEQKLGSGGGWKQRISLGGPPDSSAANGRKVKGAKPHRKGLTLGCKTFIPEKNKLSTLCTSCDYGFVAGGVTICVSVHN
ncbi:Hypothetical predicted protein [Pelobates cultripes]|uniref:Uncharacterized protein n=1 Tax=Pelobates cultripes TaxID=61616 RepID=A0AAD1WLA4_PELCU|nr:Hypothetical predicted protein [Pelobates cultripes]